MMVGPFKLSMLAVMTLATGGLVLPAMSLAQQPPATRPAIQRPGAAQGSDPVARLAQRFQDEMAGLDLTANQQSQVDKIIADAREQAEALRADARTNKTPPAERAQGMQALTKETQQKILQVLTPEQKQKVREQMAQQNGGPGMAVLQRIQKVAAELNLTDDQRAKLQAIMADVREQVQSIRDKSQGDRQAAMQELQTLLRDSREKIMQLLTPEQSQKLAELLKDRPGHGNGPATRPDAVAK
jgi:Spy/CpxP family protein refolding chaperone